MEDIVTAIWKRRLMFYGDLERMNPHRLTQRIHSSISNKSSYCKWSNQVKNDLIEAEINPDLVWNRTLFRDTVKSSKKLQPLTSTTQRPNCKWTEEK